MEAPREVASGAGTAAEPASPGVSLRCWGARGSIPTPGVQTTRYGGNTSCVEIRVGDRRLIFDAGSGIRLLGGELSGLATLDSTDIFLTHFHWDHIQGFPFFAPLYDPRIRLRIAGPEQQDLDIQTLFARQMGPVYFPVPFEAVAASTSFRHIGSDPWISGDVQVRAMQMRHASVTMGYRVDAEGVVICYIPDNELEGGRYPVDGPEWRSRLLEFVRDADILIHDSTYTDEEYRQKAGWGHSTFEQSAELAKKANVRELLFFHHAPERTDDELDRILDRMREGGVREGGALLDAAREGEVKWMLPRPK